MTQFFRLIAINHDAIERERLALRPAREGRPTEEDLGVLLRVIGMELRHVPFAPHNSVPDLFNPALTFHYAYRCVTEGGRTLTVLDTEVQPVSPDYVRYTTMAPGAHPDPRD